MYRDATGIEASTRKAPIQDMLMFTWFVWKGRMAEVSNQRIATLQREENCIISSSTDVST